MGTPWSTNLLWQPTVAADCYTNCWMGRPAQRQLRAGTLAACTLLAMLASAALLAAQNQNQDQHPPAMPPGELVRLAVANEVAAARNPSLKHLFCSLRKTSKGTQTRLYVETKDSMAAMLIAVDGHPLTPQQEQVEASHLAWLAENPEQLRKKQAREKEDEERSFRIVKALPDAFRYEYAGAANQETGLPASGPLVRLKFTPNPSYSPPSHVEQVLTGMEGYLLIDSASRRLARIDGTLFRDVTFGWGIAGRLDKGGRFVVQQADVGDGAWEITEMQLNITGKILLFKTLNMISDESFNDFHRVPDNLPFARGVELLKAEEKKLAQGNSTPEPSDAKKIPQ